MYQRLIHYPSGRLGVRRLMVMGHDIRLLMAALCAEEYLAVQIKDTVGRLD
jgi:hypothetical protein